MHLPPDVGLSLTYQPFLLENGFVFDLYNRTIKELQSCSPK
jgi:hypothetical protein